MAATRRLLARTGLTMADLEVVELNEAFAAQGLACLRELGLPDDAEQRRFVLAADSVQSENQMAARCMKPSVYRSRTVPAAGPCVAAPRNPSRLAPGGVPAESRTGPAPGRRHQP